MPRRRQPYTLGVQPGRIWRPRKILPHFGLGLLLLGSLLLSHLITSRFGVQVLVLAIAGLLFTALFSIISFRNLFIPFVVWILSIGGFRFLFTVQSPVLPDLYLDRIMMIWLTAVFLVKFFAEKKTLRGPFLLDYFVLFLVVYILMHVVFLKMVAFHEWTMSYLIPGCAYFFAKNVVTKYRQVRGLLWALLALLTYYGITSIAEKYRIEWLIWPKYILWEDYFVGRSDGPFMHAPLFGTVIGMMLPINLYFIATVRSSALKIILYINLALGMAGLFFTYTRGSWLAGIMALIAMIVLNHRQYLKLVLPAAILFPILAVNTLSLGQDKFMMERIENENTFGSRFGIMATTTKVWRDHPVFGVGFYQYRFVMGDYVDPVNVPGLGLIRVSQFRHVPPHDIFFAYLAETGLVGAFLQGGIYFLVFRTVVRHYRRRDSEDEFTSQILPVFAGLFLGYLVGGLAIDYKFFSMVGTLFYTCAGILYGYRREEYQGAPMVAGTASGVQVLPRGRIGRLPQVE